MTEIYTDPDDSMTAANIHPCRAWEIAGPTVSAASDGVQQSTGLGAGGRTCVS
jgi:hypothetical protein